MARILFGVTVPITASAFLRPQLKRLVEQGWEVHLACSPEREFDLLKSVPGLHLHGLPMKRNPSPIADLLSLYRWNRLVKEVGPDIVVGSTPKAGLLSMLASKWNRIPARVYHIRGFRAEGLSGAARKVAMATEWVTTHLASNILCDSHSLRDELIKFRLLRTGVAVVLGHGSCCGVDIEHFREPNPRERDIARTKLGLGDSDFVVGFVGRITEDKGISELASAVFAAREYDDRIKLVLVGTNEAKRSLSMLLSDNNAIIQPGFWLDVRSAYWAFDCFIFPSHREGFGQASIEAQACGIATVVSNATGIRDSVPPTAVIPRLQVGDETSIFRAIQLLSTNPELRLQSGHEGRIWVQTHFDSRYVSKLFIDYYKSLIRSP